MGLVGGLNGGWFELGLFELVKVRSVLLRESYKWVGWVWDGMGWISVWGYCMRTALRC